MKACLRFQFFDPLDRVGAPHDAIELSWEFAQLVFVGAWMQTPNARNLGRFLDYFH